MATEPTGLAASAPPGGPGAARWAAAWSFALLALVYGATATWTYPYHTDALTNAVTAWHLADDGRPYAPEYAELLAADRDEDVSLLVASPGGPVSQYPPGTAALVAPFYAVAGVDLSETTLYGEADWVGGVVAVPAPPVWPATLAAVLATAGVAAALAATLVRSGLGAATATAVAAVAGLGTSAWSVASSASWTHGPAMLAVALAALAAAGGRWSAAGLALGAGILVRPHLALVAAALGLWTAARRRDWRPAVQVGVGAGLGLVLLVAYNAAVHGEPSLLGGYADGFEEQLVSGDVVWFLGNVARGLLDPWYGLLTWAPFLLVVVPVAWRRRHELPDWSVGAAIGGVLYLLVQWKANRASGGDWFFPYRYPLEMLVAAAPALGLATVAWLRSGPARWHRGALVVTLAVAVAGQVAGALAT